MTHKSSVKFDKFMNCTQKLGRKQSRELLTISHYLTDD